MFMLSKMKALPVWKRALLPLATYKGHSLQGSIMKRLRLKVVVPLLTVPLIVCAQSPPDKLHTVEIDQRLLAPDEGLLLGNGDLSASVYQTADRIIWRLGKSDVWDRRWDNSDDPRPLHIDELRQGIEEKWKAGHGQKIIAKNSKASPERLKEISLDSPSYRQRPYPCPKPTGELCLQLPVDADLANANIKQRLVIEEARHEITYSWTNGRELKVESFIHPECNALVVHWQMSLILGLTYKEVLPLLPAHSTAPLAHTNII